MPLGYDDFFDFRKYLPPGSDMSMYNVPVSADGPGTFTSAAPEVPMRRVQTTPAAPVVVPDPPPSPMTPGSDAAKTIPDAADPYHTPVSRKVPEVVTPIVGPAGAPAPDDRRVPTLASTAPAPDTWDQRWSKLMENKDFSGAVKALSGAFGKKPPAPPVYHVSAGSHASQLPDQKGAAQQLLASLMKNRQGAALAQGELGAGQQKRRRAQDRFAGMPGEGRR